MDDFPIKLWSSVGGLLDYSGDKNAKMICGGAIEGGQEDKCFHLSAASSKQWIPGETRMSGGRIRAASIVIDIDNGKALWVTGGYRKKLGVLKSTELVSVKHGSNSGPDLPEPLHRHCLVKLNSSSAMLIGGQAKRKPPHE